MKRVAFALALSLVTIAARADTPPSRWDEARDPDIQASWRLHVYVRQLFVSGHEERTRAQLARKARVLLEDAGAAMSADTRLRFDLGRACLYLEDWASVVRVLEPALALDPDSPAALEAYGDLATAYAWLDESAAERRVYERELARVTDDRQRAILYLNYAEAEMHLGRTGIAIEEYREAIDLAATLPNYVALEDRSGALAQWGLAVAIDRSNDVIDGARETDKALSLDSDMQLIMRGANVFFSPKRERDWYIALGFAQYAKRASTPDASAMLWSRAEGCWREYVADALATAPPADRWIDLARARFDAAHVARVAAEKRAKKRIVDADQRCAD